MDPNEVQDAAPDSAIFVSVAADEDTWLPQVLLGFPLQPDSVEDLDIFPESLETAMVTLTPETAYQVGAALIQAAGSCTSFFAELIEKDIEERKEIFLMEHAFVDEAPDPRLN